MTKLKAAAYLITGVLLIYGATWLPSAAFYAFFQREILRLDPAGGVGALVWAEARHLPAPEQTGGGASGKTEPAAAPRWSQLLHQGLLLPLPPGNIQKIAAAGETLIVDYEKATVTVDRFPPGFLRRVFLDEYEKVGGSVDALAGLDEATLLFQVAAATPRDFRFNMKGAERMRYAAALLSKMLLWEAPACEKDAPRPAITLFRGPEGRSSGALLVREGTARALVASPEGLLAFGLRGSWPREWVTDASRWAELVPAEGPARDLWSQEVRRRYPEGHPLWLWAKDSLEGADRSARLTK